MVQFLPWAELALNCHYHAGLGTSSFRALYGREPPSLLSTDPSPTVQPSVAEIITERQVMLAGLRRNLSQAQQRLRDTANRHHRDVHFEVGDLVLLKLQPYKQHSVARPLSAKLARRFYGPFRVSEKVGPVAYRLDLPEGSRIHNVFHVSLLRPFISGSPSTPVSSLPAAGDTGRAIATPVAILDRRIILQQGLPIEQGLTRWSDGDDSAASWEPLEVIKSHFPAVLLGDKELLDIGGVNTSMDKDLEAQPIVTPDESHPSATASPSSRQQISSGMAAPAGPAQQPIDRPRRATRRPDRFKDYSSH